MSKTYTFELILEGVPEITAELEDALFNSGCDDAALCQREGVIYLEFMREADSFSNALLSAIRDVNKSDCSAAVSHVGLYDSVTLPLIVERTGIHRQRLHQYVVGTRGAGGFPNPIYGSGKSMIYSWNEVITWLKTNTDIQVNQDTDTDIIDAVNGMLITSKHVKTKKELVRLWDNIKCNPK